MSPSNSHKIQSFDGTARPAPLSITNSYYLAAASSRGAQSCMTGSRAKSSPSVVARISHADRLMRRVIQTSDGCWEWTGERRGGYGRVCINGKKIQAHRLSYSVFVGDVPPEMFVCHRCDNPCCLNPTHLFLGTTQDNMDDCRRKNRTASGHRSTAARYPERVARGERHPCAKLSIEQVQAIRRDTRPQKEIAREFGIYQSAVSKIKNRKRWAVLP